MATIDLTVDELRRADVRSAFNIQLAETLKLEPQNYFGRTMLEVKTLFELGECFNGRGFELIRHRSDELTARYKGRRISTDWIAGFIKSNTDTALFLTDVNRIRQLQKELETAPAPKHPAVEKKTHATDTLSEVVRPLPTGVPVALPTSWQRVARIDFNASEKAAELDQLLARNEHIIRNNEMFGLEDQEYLPREFSYWQRLENRVLIYSVITPYRG